MSLPILYVTPVSVLLNVGSALFHACFQSSRLGKPGKTPAGVISYHFICALGFLFYPDSYSSMGISHWHSPWCNAWNSCCQGLHCSDALIRHVLQKFRTGKGDKPLLGNLLEMERTSLRLGKWIEVAWHTKFSSHCEDNGILTTVIDVTGMYWCSFGLVPKFTWNLSAQLMQQSQDHVKIYKVEAKLHLLLEPWIHFESTRCTGFCVCVCVCVFAEWFIPKA